MIWMSLTYILAVTGIVGVMIFWEQSRLVAYVGVLGLVYAAGIITLSHPRPSYFDLGTHAEAEVLGGKAIKDDRVYLLLLKRGDNRPVYLSFPWDDELARKLQRHQFKGTAKWDRTPYGSDRRLEFIPPRPLPPKQMIPQAPEFQS